MEQTDLGSLVACENCRTVLAPDDKQVTSIRDGFKLSHDCPSCEKRRPNLVNITITDSINPSQKSRNPTEKY